MTDRPAGTVVPDTASHTDPTLESHDLIAQVGASGLFDAGWYRAAHPDAGEADPLVYFVEIGLASGHDPGPDFDGAFYLAGNPDVAEAGIHPLLHYLRHGRAEGRLPLPGRRASGPVPADPEWQRQAAELGASGLFHEDWYRATYPDVVAEDALAHFLRTGWRDGHDPGPGFDGAFYLARYPDVSEAGFNPVLHYLRYGRAEARLPVRPPEPEPDTFAAERIGPLLSRFQLDAGAAMSAIDEHRRPEAWPRFAPGTSVAVCVHSGGNIFMREIAELVAAGFAAAGYDTGLHDETVARAEAPDAAAVRVIVAPHEFFHLSSNGHVVPAEWAEGAILLNVEQLHMPWFRVGLPALRRARAVLDINLPSAAVLATLGFPAAYLPLGHVDGVGRFALQPTLPDLPALRTLEAAVRQSCPAPEAPLAERPIDIFFIGHLSPRRAGIFERMAERLARWRCHFVLTDADRPQVSGLNAILESEATIGLAQRAKIILNLHQSDELFFEWHRVVLQGIWQRTLVVSEALAAQSSFVGGDHFLEAPTDELSDLIDWLLGTEAGRAVAERVRTRAHQQLTTRVRLDETVRGLFGTQSSDRSLADGSDAGAGDLGR